MNNLDDTDSETVERLPLFWRAIYETLRELEEKEDG